MAIGLERGMGIAAALLERVCCDAKAEGFAAVEGYAKAQKDRVYYDYNGPIRLYEKAVFVEVVRVFVDLAFKIGT